MNTIDPRANVSPNAVIADGVSVGPFSTIEAGAVVGENTTIAANALIGCGARIGKGCKIHHGAVVGHAPQDLKYAGEPTTCEIGDRTEIREYAVLHRGTGEGGRTIIGRDNYLMAFTHIAHDCVLGDHIIMSNAAMMAGHCVVDDWVIIGGITPIHQFVHIGRHAMIGGGLRVPKDVPPFVLAGGAPLCFEGLNSIGLKRRGFSREAIHALDESYNLIYRAKMNVSQAIARITATEELMAYAEVRQVVEFVTGSQRGIIGAPRTHG
ncbi:MAG TPA: acyl-ACP--UDP-N-acetylglucosamine O-acyltransferase [Bacteroidota bacterium]|nr:acyl-ACP--UDP-N-acetylglucosamine O-acyltransferase [Bacteroidota bacterium]